LQLFSQVSSPFGLAMSGLIPLALMPRGKILPRGIRASGIRPDMASPKGELTCENNCKAA
jgi:hypothetical protein